MTDVSNGKTQRERSKGDEGKRSVGDGIIEKGGRQHSKKKKKQHIDTAEHKKSQETGDRKTHNHKDNATDIKKQEVYNTR